jgi:hypothetical protein
MTNGSPPTQPPGMAVEAKGLAKPDRLAAPWAKAQVC